MAAAAAAAAAAGEVKKIDGLASAIDLIDGGLRGVVVYVTCLEVRGAPAILQVITSAGSPESLSWTLPDGNKTRLEHVSRINSEIDVLLRVVITRLKDSPTSAKDGRLLNRYGWSLQRTARKVVGKGSAFHAAVRDISVLLRTHADHLFSHNQGQPTCGIEFLSDNLEELEEKLLDVKGLTVYIPEVNQIGGGGSNDGKGKAGAGNAKQEGKAGAGNAKQEGKAGAGSAKQEGKAGAGNAKQEGKAGAGNAKQEDKAAAGNAKQEGKAAAGNAKQEG